MPLPSLSTPGGEYQHGKQVNRPQNYLLKFKIKLQKKTCTKYWGVGEMLRNQKKCWLLLLLGGL